MAIGKIILDSNGEDFAPASIGGGSFEIAGNGIRECIDYFGGSFDSETDEGENSDSGYDSGDISYQKTGKNQATVKLDGEGGTTTLLLFFLSEDSGIAYSVEEGLFYFFGPCTIDDFEYNSEG